PGAGYPRERIALDAARGFRERAVRAGGTGPRRAPRRGERRGVDRRCARRAADDPRARALEGLRTRPERRSRAVVTPTRDRAASARRSATQKGPEMVTNGKRRLLAAFALTTVGAVVLAGCSGGSEPEAEEESGPVTLTL